MSSGDSVLLRVVHPKICFCNELLQLLRSMMPQGFCLEWTARWHWEAKTAGVLTIHICTCVTGESWRKAGVEENDMPLTFGCCSKFSMYAYVLSHSCTRLQGQIIVWIVLNVQHWCAIFLRMTGEEMNFLSSYIFCMAASSIFLSVA